MRIRIGAALLLIVAACEPAGRPVATADEAISRVHESLRGTPQVAGPFTATRQGDAWIVRVAPGDTAYAVDARTGAIASLPPSRSARRGPYLPREAAGGGPAAEDGASRP